MNSTGRLDQGERRPRFSPAPKGRASGRHSTASDLLAQGRIRLAEHRSRAERSMVVPCALRQARVLDILYQGQPFLGEHRHPRGARNRGHARQVLIGRLGRPIVRSPCDPRQVGWPRFPSHHVTWWQQRRWVIALKSWLRMHDSVRYISSVIVASFCPSFGAVELAELTGCRPRCRPEAPTPAPFRTPACQSSTDAVPLDP